MPWCDTCQRRWGDDEVGAGTTCPKCGAGLDEDRGLPWHFKLLAGGTAVYLLWRLGQGLDWLARYAGRHI